MHPVLEELQADSTPITIKYEYFTTYLSAVYKVETYAGPVATTHIWSMSTWNVYYPKFMAKLCKVVQQEDTVVIVLILSPKLFAVT